jgi:hypothetical protein
MSGPPFVKRDRSGLSSVSQCRRLGSVPLPLLQPMLAVTGQPGGDPALFSLEVSGTAGGRWCTSMAVCGSALVPVAR